MKTHLFSILLLTAGCCIASAQTERYVTITAQSPDGSNRTNQVSIVEGETAEVVSFWSSNGSWPSLTKDGIYFYSILNANGLGFVVVKGPATFTLIAGGTAGAKALLTLKIKPESFPPGETLILPTGTVGIVHVESSTNLIQWQDEWVHTFSNTNENRFFRIRAERSLP